MTEHQSRFDKSSIGFPEPAAPVSMELPDDLSVAPLARTAISMAD
jgi:hypothetical protein